MYSKDSAGGIPWHNYTSPRIGKALQPIGARNQPAHTQNFFSSFTPPAINFFFFSSYIPPPRAKAAAQKTLLLCLSFLVSSIVIFPSIHTEEGLAGC